MSDGMEWVGLSKLSCSLQRRSSLERELSRTKEDLSVFSVELRAMIRAFKEQQLNMTTPRSDCELYQTLIMFTNPHSLS